MLDALLRSLEITVDLTLSGADGEAFAPWTQEFVQQVGLQTAVRSLLRGPAASALECATRSLRPAPQQLLAVDSDAPELLAAGLSSLRCAHGTVPRMQRVVHCFPVASNLLRSGFDARRDAMLDDGGWLVALGWSDDAWGSGERIFAKALALMHGVAPRLPTPATTSLFEHVAATARREGLHATVTRGRRHALSPEQIWTLLAATRFVVNLSGIDIAARETLRALVLDAIQRTPPALWSARLDYLVIEKPRGSPVCAERVE